MTLEKKEAGKIEKTWTERKFVATETKILQKAVCMN